MSPINETSAPIDGASPSSSASQNVNTPTGGIVGEEASQKPTLQRQISIKSLAPFLATGKKSLEGAVPTQPTLTYTIANGHNFGGTTSTTEAPTNIGRGNKARKLVPAGAAAAESAGFTFKVEKQYKPVMSRREAIFTAEKPFKPLPKRPVVFAKQPDLEFIKGSVSPQAVFASTKVVEPEEYRSTYSMFTAGKSVSVSSINKPEHEPANASTSPEVIFKGFFKSDGLTGGGDKQKGKMIAISSDVTSKDLKAKKDVKAEEYRSGYSRFTAGKPVSGLSINDPGPKPTNPSTFPKVALGGTKIPGLTLVDESMGKLKDEVIVVGKNNKKNKKKKDKKKKKKGKTITVPSDVTSEDPKAKKDVNPKEYRSSYSMFTAGKPVSVLSINNPEPKLTDAWTSSKVILGSTKIPGLTLLDESVDKLMDKAIATSSKTESPAEVNQDVKHWKSPSDHARFPAKKPMMPLRKRRIRPVKGAEINVINSAIPPEVVSGDAEIKGHTDADKVIEELASQVIDIPSKDSSEELTGPRSIITKVPLSDGGADPLPVEPGCDPETTLSIRLETDTELSVGADRDNELLSEDPSSYTIFTDAKPIEPLHEPCVVSLKEPEFELTNAPISPEIMSGGVQASGFDDIEKAPDRLFEVAVSARKPEIIAKDNTNKSFYNQTGSSDIALEGLKVEKDDELEECWSSDSMFAGAESISVLSINEPESEPTNTTISPEVVPGGAGIEESIGTGEVIEEIGSEVIVSSCILGIPIESNTKKSICVQAVHSHDSSEELTGPPSIAHTKPFSGGDAEPLFEDASLDQTLAVKAPLPMNAEFDLEHSRPTLIPGDADPVSGDSAIPPTLQIPLLMDTDSNLEHPESITQTQSAVEVVKVIEIVTEPSQDSKTPSTDDNVINSEDGSLALSSSLGTPLPVDPECDFKSSLSIRVESDTESPLGDDGANNLIHEDPSSYTILTDAKPIEPLHEPRVVSIEEQEFDCTNAPISPEITSEGMEASGLDNGEGALARLVSEVKPICVQAVLSDDSCEELTTLPGITPKTPLQDGDAEPVFEDASLKESLALKVPLLMNTEFDLENSGSAPLLGDADPLPAGSGFDFTNAPTSPEIIFEGVEAPGPDNGEGALDKLVDEVMVSARIPEIPIESNINKSICVQAVITHDSCKELTSLLGITPNTPLQDGDAEPTQDPKTPRTDENVLNSKAESLVLSSSPGSPLPVGPGSGSESPLLVKLEIDPASPLGADGDKKPLFEDPSSYTILTNAKPIEPLNDLCVVSIKEPEFDFINAPTSPEVVFEDMQTSGLDNGEGALARLVNEVRVSDSTPGIPIESNTNKSICIQAVLSHDSCEELITLLSIAPKAPLPDGDAEPCFEDASSTLVFSPQTRLPLDTRFDSEHLGATNEIPTNIDSSKDLKTPSIKKSKPGDSQDESLILTIAAMTPLPVDTEFNSETTSWIFCGAPSESPLGVDGDNKLLYESPSSYTIFTAGKPIKLLRERRVASVKGPEIEFSNASISREIIFGGADAAGLDALDEVLDRPMDEVVVSARAPEAIAENSTNKPFCNQTVSSDGASEDLKAEKDIKVASDEDLSTYSMSAAGKPTNVVSVNTLESEPINTLISPGAMYGSMEAVGLDDDDADETFDKLVDEVVVSSGAPEIIANKNTNKFFWVQALYSEDVSSSLSIAANVPLPGDADSRSEDAALTLALALEAPLPTDTELNLEHPESTTKTASSEPAGQYKKSIHKNSPVQVIQIATKPGSDSKTPLNEENVINSEDVALPLSVSLGTPLAEDTEHVSEDPLSIIHEAESESLLEIDRNNNLETHQEAGIMGSLASPIPIPMGDTLPAWNPKQRKIAFANPSTSSAVESSCGLLTLSFLLLSVLLFSSSETDSQRSLPVLFENATESRLEADEDNKSLHEAHPRGVKDLSSSFKVTSTIITGSPLPPPLLLSRGGVRGVGEPEGYGHCRIIRSPVITPSTSATTISRLHSGTGLSHCISSSTLASEVNTNPETSRPGFIPVRSKEATNELDLSDMFVGLEEVGTRDLTLSVTTPSTSAGTGHTSSLEISGEQGLQEDGKVSVSMVNARSVALPPVLKVKKRLAVKGVFAKIGKFGRKVSAGKGVVKLLNKFSHKPENFVE
ncbi:hypothetical protein L873DRAFT_1788630 [Choiromyces venosus 120613-1]|uniref:Uncharacterized protein n=1 Tax=Choiromyces venosus 120613-1 TaxID=1336337 RepID=A0A3N4K536_9PEZI|nr:hypothetical protein L873DRAFT_1788630 [Choiromyces venosus 120613-1]